MSSPTPIDPADRPTTHKATTIALLVIFTISVSGFFMGLRQSLREADAELDRSDLSAPAQVETAARTDDWSHLRLAPSYRELAGKKWGPNAQWQNQLNQLGAPTADEATAWALIPAQDRRAQRMARRAFDGAPPTVPHPINQHTPASCLQCHGSATPIGSMVAPQMSHALYSNCIQCHVSEEGLGSRWNTAAFDLHTGNRFGGYTAPAHGERAHAYAPPTIPHTTHQRENCLSCHGPLGNSPIRTEHPERTSCLQCHVPDASVDQRQFVSSRDARVPSTPTLPPRS